MLFREYLQEAELNVTVDTDDPAGSIGKVKDQLRTGAKNPSMAIKKRQVGLKGKETKETDPKLMAMDKQITAAEEKLAAMKLRLQQAKDRAAKQTTT